MVLSVLMEIPYVSVEMHGKAREMEDVLHRLPAQLGVIFASVEAVPAPKGSVNVFNVVLGISRRLDVSVGTKLVEDAFRSHFKSIMDSTDFNLNVRVHRGVSGAYRDERRQAAGRA